MVRLQRTEHRRLKRAPQKERNPLMRQRIQMALKETPVTSAISGWIMPDSRITG
jgi:hypothetical protein